MLDFFRLIIKNITFLVFLILELFSVFLIIQFNAPQKRLFVTSASSAIGKLVEEYQGAISFFRLKRENDQIMEENATLRAQLISLRKKLEEEHAKDFFINQEDDIIPCKVLSNSIALADNYLLLNKGKRDGIKPQMGVFSSGGVVGIIIETGEHYATAMSLLHRQARISAGIASTGFFGNMVRKEVDPYHMRIEDIPAHATVAVGDTIVTSGYSNIFPPRIPIGVVSQINEPIEGDYFKTLEVDLMNDLSNLTYVYVWGKGEDNLKNE
jgi:rod shape-determining protein MreC